MTAYIVTYHSTQNYGQFLQAFALQKKIGDCQLVKSDFNFLHNVSEKTKRRLPLLWYVLSFLKVLRKKKRNVHPENGRILFTPQMNYFRLLNRYNYGSKPIFVAGSDQIWSPTPRLKDFFFLNFGPTNAKRISYAASQDVAQWPEDFEKSVLPLLNRFSAISVREESTVEYLKKLGLKNVACVCDPTVLHDGNFYRKEFNLKELENSHPFVYKIREIIPENVKKILDDCSQQAKLVDLKNSATICSVTEWLTNINNASFVVTDSFHCAVFCILFHKSFIVLANYGSGKGMNERFQTLLGKTGLLYRVLPQNSTLEDLKKRLNRFVDWENVDSIMEEWRNNSARWLKDALEE